MNGFRLKRYIVYYAAYEGYFDLMTSKMREGLPPHFVYITLVLGHRKRHF